MTLDPTARDDRASRSGRGPRVRKCGRSWGSRLGARRLAGRPGGSCPSGSKGGGPTMAVITSACAPAVACRHASFQDGSLISGSRRGRRIVTYAIATGPSVPLTRQAPSTMSNRYVSQVPHNPRHHSDTETGALPPLLVGSHSTTASAGRPTSSSCRGALLPTPPGNARPDAVWPRSNAVSPGGLRPTHSVSHGARRARL